MNLFEAGTKTDYQKQVLKKEFPLDTSEQAVTDLFVEKKTGFHKNAIEVITPHDDPSLRD